MRRVITISFGVGVANSASLASIWTLINRGTFGHLDPMSYYPFQIFTTIVWPTAIFLFTVGPRTPMSSILVATAIALVVNGALYALVAGVAFKVFHISSPKS
jgi:hypothetical protein